MYSFHYSSQILPKVGGSRKIFEKFSNMNENRPVTVELLQADGQTAGHDAANSRFRNFATSKKYP